MPMCGVNKLFLATQYFQHFQDKSDDFRTIKDNFQISGRVQGLYCSVLTPKWTRLFVQ